MKKIHLGMASPHPSSGLRTVVAVTEANGTDGGLFLLSGVEEWRCSGLGG